MTHPGSTSYSTSQSALRSSQRTRATRLHLHRRVGRTCHGERDPHQNRHNTHARRLRHCCRVRKRPTCAVPCLGLSTYDHHDSAVPTGHGTPTTPVLGHIELGPHDASGWSPRRGRAPPKSAPGSRYVPRAAAGPVEHRVRRRGGRRRSGQSSGARVHGGASGSRGRPHRRCRAVTLVGDDTRRVVSRSRTGTLRTDTWTNSRKRSTRLAYGLFEEATEHTLRTVGVKRQPSGHVQANGGPIGGIHRGNGGFRAAAVEGAPHRRLSRRFEWLVCDRRRSEPAGHVSHDGQADRQ